MLIKYLKHTQDARPNDVKEVAPIRGEQLIKSGIAQKVVPADARETKPAAPVETKRKRKGAKNEQ
jgi:hypothetical protein